MNFFNKEKQTQKQKRKQGVEGRSLKIWAMMLLSISMIDCAYDPKETDFQASSGIDFVVSSEMILTRSSPKIGRLIFLEGGVLSTEGADVDLVVDEIISYNGTIRTKPSAVPSQAGADGLSGGTLRLRARLGRGHLTILAEGQDGAQGAKGLAGARGAQGNKGHSASVKSRSVCPLSVGTELFRDGPSPIDRCRRESYCAHQTGDGGRGATGGQGSAGAAGGRGGGAAAIQVQIDDPSLIKVVTKSLAGAGGLGGEGGGGGIGGTGGKAGDRDRGNMCRQASRGPEGPRGARGNDGPPGISGEHKPICLKLGATQIGDCKGFKDLTQSEVNRWQ